MRRLGPVLVLLLGACSGDEEPTETPAPVEEPAEPPPAPEPEPPPPPVLELEADSRYGMIPLAPGFSPDPQEHRGTARGAVAASDLGEDCTGFVSSEPLHVIEARGPFARMHLMLAAEAAAGIAFRNAAGEVTCTSLAADGDDELPYLQTHLAPGEHRVWIATEEADDPVRYVLALSEVELSPDAISEP